MLPDPLTLLESNRLKLKHPESKAHRADRRINGDFRISWSVADYIRPVLHRVAQVLHSTGFLRETGRKLQKTSIEDHPHHNGHEVIRETAGGKWPKIVHFPDRKSTRL